MSPRQSKSNQSTLLIYTILIVIFLTGATRDLAHNNFDTTWL